MTAMRINRISSKQGYIALSEKAMGLFLFEKTRMET